MRSFSNVSPAVKLITTLALISAGHIAFLFGAYGTKFFGTRLPSAMVLLIWLGVSTVAAVAAVAAVAGYFKVATKMPWLSAQPFRHYLFAIAAGAASLYVGVFLAFNAFRI